MGECRLPSNKVVYSLHKNKTMVETILAVKIFPDMETGFQLIGFLKAKSSIGISPLILVNIETLEIEGMTSGFLYLIDHKLKMDAVLKDRLKIAQVFPDLEKKRMKLGACIDTNLRLTECTDKIIQDD